MYFQQIKSQVLRLLQLMIEKELIDFYQILEPAEKNILKKILLGKISFTTSSKELFQTDHVRKYKKIRSIFFLMQIKKIIATYSGPKKESTDLKNFRACYRLFTKIARYLIAKKIIKKLSIDSLNLLNAMFNLANTRITILDECKIDIFTKSLAAESFLTLLEKSRLFSTNLYYLQPQIQQLAQQSKRKINWQQLNVAKSNTIEKVDFDADEKNFHESLIIEVEQGDFAKDTLNDSIIVKDEENHLVTRGLICCLAIAFVAKNPEGLLLRTLTHIASGFKASFQQAITELESFNSTSIQVFIAGGDFDIETIILIRNALSFLRQYPECSFSFALGLFDGVSQIDFCLTNKGQALISIAPNPKIKVTDSNLVSLWSQIDNASEKSSLTRTADQGLSLTYYK